MNTLSQTETNPSSNQARLKDDFLASIVVFLVALPLCMGIAIASGVPVASGLISGIIGGLLVGWIAGSPLQVSGPAAGLTVIVYEIVQEHGFEMLGLVVAMGGLLQLAAGSLRLGQWFRAVSPAVIRGMLAGIGILILASQFHVMIDDKPNGNGAMNLATIPSAIAKASGVPSFTSKELRSIRAEALHSVGDIHRRQIHTQQHVIDALAHEEPENLESQATIQPPSLADHVVSEQTAIKSDLERIVTTLTQAEETHADSPRSDNIRQDAEAAVTAVSLAFSNLNAPEPQSAISAQHDAVVALENLLASLKNHTVAAYLGVFTIAVIVCWQLFAPIRFRIIPAPLVAVVAATTLAFLLTLPVIYVEVPDRLAEEIHFPTVNVLRDAPWVALFQSAVLLAIVASAETLLCATAVDQMHAGARTKYDQELVAQGIGNTCCGLVGALPITGVIVRSSANVLAGGKTRASAILHGLWLLVFVAGLGFLLRMIPTASLAAMLVYTGYKLVNVKSLSQLKQYGWGEVAIYLVTVTTIVFTDLLTGVIAGILLSALKLLYVFSHLRTDVTFDADKNQAVLKLDGAATFIRLPSIANELDQVPAGAELHVDFENLSYIDHACLDLFMNWAKQHETTGGKLVVDWQSLHARFFSGPPGNDNGTDANARTAPISAGTR